MNIKGLLAGLICLGGMGSAAFAEYPLIEATSAYRDPLFKQQQKETESWYFNRARGLPPPPLTIYRYAARPGETLIQLAAAFNVSLDALATLNDMRNIRDLDGPRTLLVPSAPGVFLYTDGQDSWTDGLKEALAGENALSLRLPSGGKLRSVRYYPGRILPDSFRLKFIRQLFTPPLDALTITSPYGYRDHPFTGRWELHVGTDYRAPMNTPVKSCGAGTIFSTGVLEDYGKYIIIEHRNGYTSMYAHLNTLLVSKGDEVEEGEIVARSGNTGLSTGPHLHFEIRKNGLPQNPENLLTKSGK